MNEDSFARRTYSTMLERQMTQADLARATGIDREAITSVITGRRQPTADERAKIESAIELSSR